MLGIPVSSRQKESKIFKGIQRMPYSLRASAILPIIPYSYCNAILLPLNPTNQRFSYPLLILQCNTPTLQTRPFRGIPIPYSYYSAITLLSRPYPLQVFLPHIHTTVQYSYSLDPTLQRYSYPPFILQCNTPTPQTLPFRDIPIPFSYYNAISLLPRPYAFEVY